MGPFQGVPLSGCGRFGRDFFLFYGFTGHFLSLRPFGGTIFSFYVFTGLVYHPTSGPFGDHIFSFCVFTDLLCLPTSGASGGSIFLLVKKDRGERHTASSQTAHPSFPAEAEKLSRSVAPPSPTKPAGAGLWRGPLEAALWKPALIRGNGGETCVGPTSSHWCN